jgi:hypothetical protein
MDLAVPRYYVRIPRPAEILTMPLDDLDKTTWLLFDYHCLSLPTQNQLRRLPEDQVRSLLVPSVMLFRLLNEVCLRFQKRSALQMLSVLPPPRDAGQAVDCGSKATDILDEWMHRGMKTSSSVETFLSSEIGRKRELGDSINTAPPSKMPRVASHDTIVTSIESRAPMAASVVTFGSDDGVGPTGSYSVASTSTSSSDALRRSRDKDLEIKTHIPPNIRFSHSSLQRKGAEQRWKKLNSTYFSYRGVFKNGEYKSHGQLKEQFTRWFENNLGLGRKEIEDIINSLEDKEDYRYPLAKV